MMGSPSRRHMRQNNCENIHRLAKTIINDKEYSQKDMYTCNRKCFEKLQRTTEMNKYLLKLFLENHND